MNANVEKSILDHWNSFVTHTPFILTSGTHILPTGTGIFNAWHSLYLEGKQLGPATSYEYDSVDWNGNAIKCQDFGSCRIEYYLDTGVWHAYGPTGLIQ